MNLDVARRKDAASFGGTVRDVYVRVDKTTMSLYPPFQRSKAASLLALCAPHSSRSWNTFLVAQSTPAGGQVLRDPI